MTKQSFYKENNDLISDNGIIKRYMIQTLFNLYKYLCRAVFKRQTYNFGWSYRRKNKPDHRNSYAVEIMNLLLFKQRQNFKNFEINSFSLDEKGDQNQTDGRVAQRNSYSV